MAIANWTCVSWVAYAPGTVAINVTWIEREFNACQTPRSMYPSIFNHFCDIARYRWRVTGFWQFSWANERFLPHYAFHWVRPWDNRGKCHRVGKRIQCLSNASQHVPIYLQPFLRYSELLVENCDIFRPPPLFSGSAGDDHWPRWNFSKILIYTKLHSVRNKSKPLYTFP